MKKKAKRVSSIASELGGALVEGVWCISALVGLGMYIATSSSIGLWVSDQAMRDQQALNANLMPMIESSRFFPQFGYFFYHTNTQLDVLANQVDEALTDMEYSSGNINVCHRSAVYYRSGVNCDGALTRDPTTEYLRPCSAPLSWNVQLDTAATQFLQNRPGCKFSVNIQFETGVSPTQYKVTLGKTEFM